MAIWVAATSVLAQAQTPATSAAAERRLPVAVRAALAEARLPAAALSFVVEEAGASARSAYTWQPLKPVPPASLMKLVTTAAALDLLGPAWTWSTPVWLRGAVQDGVLDGDVVIQGSGDPSLVLERLWLLLRRVRLAGIREIHGDIVLDTSVFPEPQAAAGDFDGESWRPYNVRPDALLLNLKALHLHFSVAPDRRSAVVVADPDLAGVRVQDNLPLTTGPCPELWREALAADFSDANAIRFKGRYPLACGDRDWPIAYAEPGSYDARLISTLWRDMGGQLDGAVRGGQAPTTAPTFVVESPPLANVVHDINKYSNNVMAEQLFLTLGLTQRGSGTAAAARDVLQQWLARRTGSAAVATAAIDNGSGLSRSARLSTRLLADVLQAAWASNWMPELLASLPVPGVDGTLRTSRAAPGRGHLKTGTLRDAIGIAGIVQADDGRRYVVTAIVNDANAAAARPVLDALMQWAITGAKSPTAD